MTKEAWLITGMTAGLVALCAGVPLVVMGQRQTVSPGTPGLSATPNPTNGFTAFTVTVPDPPPPGPPASPVLTPTTGPAVEPNEIPALRNPQMPNIAHVHIRFTRLSNAGFQEGWIVNNTREPLTMGVRLAHGKSLLPSDMPVGMPLRPDVSKQDGYGYEPSLAPSEVAPFRILAKPADLREMMAYRVLPQNATEPLTYTFDYDEGITSP
jgi:hypothetical protein